MMAHIQGDPEVVDAAPAVTRSWGNRLCLAEDCRNPSL